MKKVSFIFPLMWMLVFSLVFVGCKKEEDAVPSFRSNNIEVLSATEVNLNYSFAFIANSGNTDASDYGFVWSTSPGPTLDSQGKFSLGKASLNTSGLMIANLKDLMAGTTYFIRPYFIGKELTTYGEEQTFTTKVPEISEVKPWAASSSTFMTYEPGTNFTHIQIIGNGFTKDITKNIVKINDVEVQVSLHKYGGLEAKLPANIKDSIAVTLTTGSMTVAAPQKAFIYSGKWTKKADFPTSIFNAGSFTIGEKGYVVAGAQGNQVTNNEVWEYDMQGNIWSKKADFPGKPGWGAVAFSIGTIGYVIFPSKDDGVYNKEFWAYDARLNTWTRKADFPGIARKSAIGTRIGDKGYVGLGESTTLLKDFWEYDPTRDSWIRMTDYPGVVDRGMNIFSIVGTDKAYVLQGENLFEFSALSNQWMKKGNFPGIARRYACSFSIGTKGFYGLGDPIDGKSVLNADMWEYLPSQDKWIRKVNVSNSIDKSWAISFGTISGERAYILGGHAGYTFEKDLWELLPDQR